MTLRARCAAALALAAALTWHAVAHADQLLTANGGIVEKSHVIDLTLSRGHARLRVVRALTNEGDQPDQAALHVALPEGAVATGLRTRDMRSGQPVWREGELLERKVAASRYQAPGVSGSSTRGPALLSWRAPRELALEWFPFRPEQEEVVGYDLVLPTTWAEGREQVSLAALGLPEALARATLRTDIPGGKLFIDGVAITPGTEVRLGEAHVIEVEPPRRSGPVEGRLAAIAIGPERGLVALRVDAPRALSEVPRSARVVIALDASRSLEVDDATAEMRAASAFLAHFEGKDARVAVIAYDRRVRDLTRGFVSVADARSLLDGPTVALANGSAIDDAIARASALLATAPVGLPKRLVVIGDLQTRHGVDPTRITPPPGTIVHVASVSFGPARTDRDDSAWATLPRATGGLLFHDRASTEPVTSAHDRSDRERAFLEWARPVRIDRLRVRLAGAPPGLDEPDWLEEGGTLAYRALQSTLPASATIEGELWSKPFRREIVATASENKLWSALVFGTDIAGHLEDGEMTGLARAGGAVSPVTSYLVDAPGVRPPSEALGESMDSISVCSPPSFAACSTGGSSRVHLDLPDPHRVLASLLRHAVEQCDATGRVHLDAQTTDAEIVDLAVEVSGDAPDGARTTCVTEAAWALELPDPFRGRRFDLDVSL